MSGQLERIPLPPRAHNIPPPPGTQVQRTSLFPPKVGGGDKKASVHSSAQVVAPNLQTISGTCPEFLWPLALRLFGKVFNVTRKQPFSVVCAAMEEDADYRKLVVKRGHSNEQALKLMGYDFSDVPGTDTVLFEGSERGTRWALVDFEDVQEKVEIDPRKGPVADGVSEKMGYCGKTECVGWGKKPWAGMTSTEREVWLILVAQHQRREKIEGPKQTTKPLGVPSIYGSHGPGRKDKYYYAEHAAAAKMSVALV